MKIHNFYTDIMRSITFLFDNYIFNDDNVIKKYIFNISNYSFQITTDTQYELPTAFVSLTSSEPINLHPTNIQRLGISNINRIPVIYNRTKDLYIELQEEHYLMNFTVTINCETPLQAKDVEFKIFTMLPLNKWTICYGFSSFISLDTQYLDKEILDTENHDIVNLYRIFDYDQGKSSYAFSVFYNPYVRLDSIETNIGTTNQKSFQVNLSLSYMITFPQYLFIPVEDRPHSEFNRTFTFNNIVVDISPDDYKLILFEHQSNDYSLFKYDENLTNRTFNDKFLQVFKSKLNYSRTRAKVIWSSLDLLSSDTEIIIQKESDSLKLLDTHGKSYGEILHYHYDEVNHDITGILIGKILDKNINQPIKLKYFPIHTIYDISYTKYPIISGYETKSIKLLTKTNYLLSLIPGVNENKVDLDIFKTTLKSIIFDNGTDNLTEINVNSRFSDDRIFVSIPDICTMIIYYDNARRLLRHDYTSVNPDYKPVALVFDPIVVNARKTYGGTRIERITIDLNNTRLEPISFVNVFDKNSFENTPTHQLIRSLYNTALYNINIPDDNSDTFDLTIPINIPSWYNDLVFRLRSNYYIYESNYEIPYSILVKSFSRDSLTLTIYKSFFLAHFRKITPENPLFVYILRRN